MILAVDPADLDGRGGGAAVVMDGHRVVAWAVWPPRPHGPRLDVILEHAPGSRAVVERIEGRSKATRGLVTLAEAAGWWVGALESRGATVERVRCQDWRRDVLRLKPATTADACEQAAEDALWGAVGLKRCPVRWPVDPPPGMPRVGHLAEAIGMGLWLGGWRA